MAKTSCPLWYNSLATLAPNRPNPTTTTCFFKCLSPTGDRTSRQDPADAEVEWSYPADERDAFSSFCCGNNQRLANGNTLINESEKGHAFEVDPEGRIVWEFWSPHRVGPKRKKVATLFGVARLPRGANEAWLEEHRLERQRAPDS